MDIRLHAKVPPASASPSEVAAYVGSVAAELSDLARRQGFTTLAYILDMARLEAETKHDPRPARVQTTADT